MQLNINPSKNDIQKDIKEISEFDNEGISYYLTDPFTFNNAIIIGDNSKVVGAGVLRVLNEFKITLNPTLSEFQKAKAINLLMKEALPKAQCNEILLNITKDGLNFTKLLQKHYNFEFYPGIQLRLEK